MAPRVAELVMPSSPEHPTAHVIGKETDNLRGYLLSRVPGTLSGGARTKAKASHLPVQGPPIRSSAKGSLLSRVTARHCPHSA